MSVFLSLISGWELHLIMFGLFGEPQSSALGSRGLDEVDSDLCLVLSSLLLGLKPQAPFTWALVHFHFQVLSGGSWATARGSRGTVEVY